MGEEITALETQDAEDSANALDGAEGAEELATDEPRTYTQEEFDAALEAAVKERTAGAIRERVNRSKKQQRELSSTNKELAAQVETLTNQLAELQSKEQRRETAHRVSEATGVPAELLRGDTEEELTAHAEALKAYIQAPSAPYVSSDGFAASKGEQAETDWLRTAITNR